MNESLDKNPLRTALMVNFAIILSYTILIKKENYGIILDAFAVVVLFAVNMILAIIVQFFGNKKWVKPLLIAALLVALVGFGVCSVKYAR